MYGSVVVCRDVCMCEYVSVSANECASVCVCGSVVCWNVCVCVSLCV